MQDTQHNSLPVVPLVVGTLLTLCLCGVGLLGYRRIRTARIPAVLANKSTNEYIGRPWYRVRPQQPRPIAPSQAAMPISPAPESPILAQLEGPKTGPVRRLSRIHLEKLMEEPANTWEKEV